MPKKQSDGRYRQKITVGAGADGKPIVKYASGRTKRELAENAAELRKRFVGGVEVDRGVLFGPYAEEWYHIYKEPKISPSSADCYMVSLKKHVLPEFGDRQLRAISANDINKFMLGKAGYGITTLRYMAIIIKNVFRVAAAQGIIDRNPALSIIVPDAETNKRRALTDAERAAVLSVGNEHPEGLLLLLLYYTGMRIGEAVGLQWRDVDFQRRVIHVSRDIDFKTGEVGSVKSRASVRDIPMPDALRISLELKRGVGNTFVLQAPQSHTHLSQATLRRRWGRLMAALVKAEPGIEACDGASILTAHYFRHNYASTLYNAGVDILSAQRFLGHADVKTTLAIYAHLSQGKEDVNADKVRQIFDLQGKVAEKLPKA